MKNRRKSLLVFRVLVACYFEKLAFVVDRNLCGYYISNAGCMLSLQICTKNRTSFRVTSSNFEWRSVDKFSRGLCLDFARTPMTSQVMAFRKEGCGLWNTFLLLTYVRYGLKLNIEL